MARPPYRRAFGPARGRRHFRGRSGRSRRAEARRYPRGARRRGAGGDRGFLPYAVGEWSCRYGGDAAHGARRRFVRGHGAHRRSRELPQIRLGLTARVRRRNRAKGENKTMAKAFASQADATEKTVTFSRLSDHAYAFTADGDPNSGVVVGDNAVMVVDAQATPKSAQAVIEQVRSVTDKPIRYVVLTSYHAVRTLGASAYEGAQVICSEMTRELIVERGAQEYKAAVQRSPRVFKSADLIPGLTVPHIVFSDRMSLWLGKLQVDLIQIGRGASRGDTVVFLPEERTLFSGDLVQSEVAPDAGDRSEERRVGK